jgi:site-specific recombinase XerD
MSTIDLYDTTPEEALERCLDDRDGEIQKATLDAHRYRLKHFVRWCDPNHIDNLKDLTGRDLQDYRYWRKNEGELKNVTLHTQMTTFRVFLKWAEDFHAVTPGLHEKVRVPKVDDGDDVADRQVEPERALEIMEYLDKFHYASRGHAIFRILFRTGVRTGGLRALDLADYHSEEQYLEVAHRPETETPLKNGDGGERPIHLNAYTCQVLDDYIESHRKEVTDDHGRQPLITSRYGRISRSGLRGQIYKFTQPCFYTRECPHGEDVDNCGMKGAVDDAGKCPSSEAPHAIRKGSITYWRARNTPAEQVGERADVNTDIIEKHYDKRADINKMEQRRDLFNRE